MLSAKQSNAISVVSINETFNISVILIDNQTRLQIGNIQWRDVTWSAIVSLYNLPDFKSNGQLIQGNTSKIIVNLNNGQIIATNLMIDTIGMYIIKIQLLSTNNEYNFSLTTNGILVKKNTSKVFF